MKQPSGIILNMRRLNKESSDVYVINGVNEFAARAILGGLLLTWPTGIARVATSSVGTRSSFEIEREDPALEPVDGASLAGN